MLEQLNMSPVVFAIGALFIVFVLYQMVGGLITLLLFGINPIQTQVVGFRVATGAAQSIFILIPTLLMVRFVSFEPVKYFRMKFPDLRLVGLALVGIFSLQQVLQIVQSLQDKIPLPYAIERYIAPMKQMIEDLYRVLVSTGTVPQLLGVMLIVALIPAIAEEFLFRGLVQPCFERRYGSWKGFIITGIIFGAYHLNPFSFIPLAILGIYLGFLAMQGESIWISASAHFFNNAVACIAYYLGINDNTIVNGNPDSMPFPKLLITFMISGGIFAMTIYYFLKFTRKPPAQSTGLPVSPEPLL